MRAAPDFSKIFRLRPNFGGLQNEEYDREHRQNNKAGDRPFFQRSFGRLPFVFSEKGFARTAERVDSFRIARLDQHQYDRRNRRNKHGDNENDANGKVSGVRRRVFCGGKKI